MSVKSDTIAPPRKMSELGVKPSPTTPKPTTSTAPLIALIAAVIALGVSGMLTFTLYQHWEFLMPA